MPAVRRGACHSIFVHDIAFSIDLNQAERHISSATRETIKHKRRAPTYFEYRPAPLRFGQSTQPVRIDSEFETSSLVDLVLYDFGAVSVIYRIPLDERSDLLALSESLYENQALLTDSRRRVEELLTLIRPAVTQANISGFVEDYAIFHVEHFGEALTIQDLTTRYAQNVAQMLRAESRELSPDEVIDALSHRISFSLEDVAIVDWNAALVVDTEPEDILTVLEFANVELLEMRFLDRRLDDALTLAYNRLTVRSRQWLPFRSNPSDLRDISRWQVDSAILFEGVNNVLKLLGDQYLARLYRLAGILRKLETLESIYQKISDQIVSRRMEVLEWIIIVLFVISILLPFFSPNLH
jgi:hypothetical protein